MKYVGCFLTSFVCLVAATLVGCGRANGSLPAASGVAVSVTNGFPGVVMVTLPNGAGFCTGVIVSKYAVLTATHCLKSAGTYTVYGPEGRVYTQTVKLAGSGTVEDTNDVGMLVFSQAIVQDASVIYGIGDSVSEGEAVTIVGYGCDNPQTSAGGGVKRYGTNSIYEKSDFLVLETPVATVGIIGDSAQAGTCFGDSGGPIFTGAENNLKVVGLTHAGGLDNSGQNYISEFTNIADNSTNRAFIHNVNVSYNLGIQGF